LQIESLDHLVLTVKDIPTTVDFYVGMMGVEKVEFGEERIALRFGKQKINLHQTGKEFEPKATKPCTGSADLCFIIKEPVEDMINALKDQGVIIIEGPVLRTGAMGNIVSAYFNDPDGNLIEISNYV